MFRFVLGLGDTFIAGFAGIFGAEVWFRKP